MLPKMSCYQYQPLPPITKGPLNLLYTRILTLLPWEQADAVRCSLEVEHLESAPPYEALSYVWGSGEATFSISCDNMTFNIKRNLYQALRHLRLQSQPRRLWVDAICIDQANVSERSRQVAYMTQIYRQASTVVVWLGLKSPSVEQAFHFASELAQLQSRLHNDPGSVKIPGRGELKTYNPEAFSEVMVVLRSKPEAAGYLIDLFEREYFERIWCIQETWSSKRCIARCESLEIDFFELVATTIYVEELRELTRPSKKQAFSRQLWVTVSSTRPQHAPSFFSDRIEGSCGDLLSLLVTMRDLKATDPRDKIYALLGISDEGIRPAMADTAGRTPDGPGFTMIRKAIAWTLESMDSLFPDKGILSPFKALQPDYEKSVKEIYSAITIFLLSKGSKYLDVLSHV
jgi:Heterokaryon incompatibility protein (HET)